MREGGSGRGGTGEKHTARSLQSHRSELKWLCNREQTIKSISNEQHHRLHLADSRRDTERRAKFEKKQRARESAPKNERNHKQNNRRSASDERLNERK